jgi:hypothetical protein
VEVVVLQHSWAQAAWLWVMGNGQGPLEASAVLLGGAVSLTVLISWFEKRRRRGKQAKASKAESAMLPATTVASSVPEEKAPTTLEAGRAAADRKGAGQANPQNPPY